MIKYGTWPTDESSAEEIRELMKTNYLVRPANYDYFLGYFTKYNDWELLVELCEYCDFGGIHTTKGTNVIAKLVLIYREAHVKSCMVAQVKRILSTITFDEYDGFFDADWISEDIKTTIAMVLTAFGIRRYGHLHLGYAGGLPIDLNMVRLLDSVWGNELIVNHEFTHEAWLSFMRDSFRVEIKDECSFVDFLNSNPENTKGWNVASWRSFDGIIDHHINDKMAYPSLPDDLKSIIQSVTTPMTNTIKNRLVELEDNLNDEEHYKVALATGIQHRWTKRAIHYYCATSLSSEKMLDWLEKCPVDKRIDLFKIDIGGMLGYSHPVFRDLTLMPDWFKGTDVYELIHGSDIQKRYELSQMLNLFQTEEPQCDWQFRLINNICQYKYIKISFGDARPFIQENLDRFHDETLIVLMENKLLTDVQTPSKIVQDYMLYQTLYNFGDLITEPHDWLTVDRVQECIDSSPSSMEVDLTIYNHIL